MKIKCVDSRVNVHFRFNKCPIYTHDGASAKFSTNSQEIDNSVDVFKNSTRLAENLLVRSLQRLKIFLKSRYRYLTLFNNNVCPVLSLLILSGMGLNTFFQHISRDYFQSLLTFFFIFYMSPS